MAAKESHQELGIWDRVCLVDLIYTDYKKKDFGISLEGGISLYPASCTIFEEYLINIQDDDKFS